jgi:hypothetical protein
MAASLVGRQTLATAPSILDVRIHCATIAYEMLQSDNTGNYMQRDEKDSSSHTECDISFTFLFSPECTDRAPIAFNRRGVFEQRSVTG